ncbi:hypothetical protein CHLRE_03g194000v5 [Chlamydomonas reinhardtii]|uniref:Pre-mRNA-splicing factor SLU7 n=1 Tax=Chlamydomonas reinhardtii TaxID=3055 RepID=A0A2K3DYH7_CHLRE|nr:uncharacterized protein CHLRE_03g194000v5 [Chlamydomonas reinhardtii]PNW85593.1 hypothetical protein CHLRE_03g194000v5 [Chlamydomonas reinhardtii]
MFKTGDEWRRQKELEEARKAGLAPAEVDENGKEINPHIPQYMATAPWYLNSDKPTLKHQRNWNDKGGDSDKWYDRGAKVYQATKWRKGACENCGAMSHKTKDCLERPRGKGAKYTNKNIAADEKVEDIKLVGFESKRDRWNGYDAQDYSRIMDRFEQLEEMRKEIRKKEELDKIHKGEKGAKEDEVAEAGEEGGAAEEDDETKIKDDEEAGFGEVKKRVRTTAGGSTGSVRNLRIREDIAKYLLNLDVNSAHYDPKSRSMREDPQPDKPAAEKLFHGDNFVRSGGEYSAWQSLTVHSINAHEKGLDVHMQANPSLAEMLYKQFKEKKEQLDGKDKEDVVAKYGSAAAPVPEDVKALAASERYVEYDRTGRVVKGVEVKAKSRYEEDVLINNHTCVWGSWWRDGQWGFACCHSTVKNSYCTGKAGESAAAQVDAAMLANMEAAAREKEAADLKKRQESKLNDYKGYNTDVWGSEGPDKDLDPKKVDAAMKKLEEREKAAMEGDKSKRKYNSLEGAGGEHVTPEEMEAYRIKKSRGDDPVAKGAGTDGYDLL